MRRYLYSEMVAYHDDTASGLDVELVRDDGRANAWLLRIGGTDQSYVDLDDPTRLEFDYIAKMAMIIDTVHPGREPLRVIHIGGAAMSLPRYIAATRPRSSQIVLEPDEQLTRYVRSHLPLPRRSGIRVRPQRGECGISQMPDNYADAVVVDAFNGPRVPADLATSEFFAGLARIMRSGGVLVGNYPDRADGRYRRRVGAAMGTRWANVAVGADPGILKGRRFGNAVLIASQEPLPVSELARRCASSPLPYRITEMPTGGARPFTRADTQESPDPGHAFG